MLLNLWQKRYKVNILVILLCLFVIQDTCINIPATIEVEFPDCLDKIEPWISRLFFDKNLYFQSIFQKVSTQAQKSKDFR